MKTLMAGLAALALIASPINSLAAAPLQFSIPGQNMPASQQVEGVRLSLLNGRTSSVSGLDISVLGLSEVDSLKGVEIGFFFGASRIKREFTGAAFSLMNWHEGRDAGLNMGFVNLVNEVRGLNFGAVNISQGNSLANIGVINYAERASFQFGIFNAAKRLDGVQIGIVNYAENGVIPVLPLVNFSKSF